MQITKSLFEAIKQSFKKSAPKKVKTKPCRIQFNGEFITLRSGKTVWRNIGFAKTALRNHLDDHDNINRALGEQLANATKSHLNYYYLPVGSIGMLMELLIKEKIIRFVEVDIAEFAEQKKL